MDSASSYQISQGLFLKALGIVYFLAFSSLAFQVKGLFGAQGIQPIRDTIATIRHKKGATFWRNCPSLFWWSATDFTLQAAAWSGALLALPVVCGFYPFFPLLCLFILYRSFCAVGAPFLHFQWDALLQETGFIAIFFALQSPPPFPMIFLYWVLLARFMFSSGLAKIVMGSREWTDLTAMQYHYETQPLPTRLGYYAHQLPKWAGKLTTLATHIIELPVPLLIFTPLPFRLIPFVLISALMAAIMATGNFAFFNVLTIALCLPLLPDDHYGLLAFLAEFSAPFAGNQLASALLSLGAAAFVTLNILEFLQQFWPTARLSRILYPFKKWHLLNQYGLFVNLTTIRYEIFIEGSDDRVHWKTYPCKWKPGDPAQAPKWVAPYHPRLDWHMWFAALSNYKRHPWLINCQLRLLEGREEVLRLFQANPFPERPPKYIRTVIYRYRFTDLKTKRQTGRWWDRKFLGRYSPEIALKETSGKEDNFKKP